jgi:hypothetical protein
MERGSLTHGVSVERAGVRVRGDWSPRALMLSVLLVLCCYYANLAKISYMDDFRAFYLASVSVHDGLDPYVNHVNVSEKYADGVWMKADSRFLYPPSSLFFLAPLGRMSYKASKTLFGTLMALCMVGVLWQLSRKYPRQTVVLLALFLTLPMFMNIDNGQMDCAMLALMLAAFYLEDGFFAGLCLGIAVSIKLAPVLALLWFIGSKRWRTVGWTIATSGVLSVAALLRYGAGYYREFLAHMVRHVDLDALPVVQHTFVTVQKSYLYIVTGEGTFAYQHDVGGYMQNPLRLLGERAGGAAGWLVLLGFTVWLFWSRRGRALTAAQSFFSFLAVALLANHLLWPMGLVACFPLTVLLVEESPAPHRAAVMLLVPLLLTKQVVGNFNFAIWMVMAGICVWQNGWFAGCGDARHLLVGPKSEGFNAEGAE